LKLGLKIGKKQQGHSPIATWPWQGLLLKERAMIYAEEMGEQHIFRSLASGKVF
jgi:hypothetical protein